MLRGVLQIANSQTGVSGEQIVADTKKWFESSIFNVENLSGFYGDFEQKYPLEYSLFVEYSGQITLPNYRSDGFLERYEAAYRDFAPYAVSRSSEIFGNRMGDLQGDLLPSPGFGHFLKGIGRRIAGEAITSLGKANKIRSGISTIDLARESMEITLNGPQVVNEDLFYALHGRGYSD